MTTSFPKSLISPMGPHDGLKRVGMDCLYKGKAITLDQLWPKEGSHDVQRVSSFALKRRLPRYTRNLSYWGQNRQGCETLVSQFNFLLTATPSIEGKTGVKSQTYA